MFASSCSIVHFSGHGDDHGKLALAGSSAGIDLHTAGDVAALLTGASAPSLVVLAACFSESVASAFVEFGVPHVVAVDRAVSEAAMVLFTREFYAALLSEGDAGGRAPSVGAAFEAAIDGLTLAANGVACRCDRCGGSGAFSNQSLLCVLCAFLFTYVRAMSVRARA